MSWLFNVSLVDQNNLLADLKTSDIGYIPNAGKISCTEQVDDVTVQSILVSDGEDGRSFSVVIQGEDEFDSVQERLRNPMRSCRYNIPIVLPIKAASDQIVEYVVTISIALEQPFTRVLAQQSP
jgi:hypothetical protein